MAVTIPVTFRLNAAPAAADGAAAASQLGIKITNVIENEVVPKISRSFDYLARAQAVAYGYLISQVTGLALDMGKALIVEPIKAAAELEQSLAKIGTLFPQLDYGGSQFRDTLLGMNANLGSTKDLAEGLYTVLQTGIDKPQEALQILHSAALLANVGFVDLNTAAKGLSTTMQAYNVQGEDAARIANLLYAGYKTANSEFTPFVTKLGTVIPVAKAAGVGLQDLVTTFASMTRMGMPADQAFTDIRMTIMKLIEPTSHASVILNKLFADLGGLDANSLPRLIEHFGGLVGFIQELDKRAAAADIPLTKIFTRVNALQLPLQIAGDKAGIFADSIAQIKATQAADALEKLNAQLQATLIGEATMAWTNLWKALATGANDSDNAITKLFHDFNQTMADPEARKGLADLVSQIEWLFMQSAKPLIYTIKLVVWGADTAQKVVSEMTRDGRSPWAFNMFPAGGGPAMASPQQNADAEKTHFPWVDHSPMGPPTPSDYGMGPINVDAEKMVETAINKYGELSDKVDAFSAAYQQMMVKYHYSSDEALRMLAPEAEKIKKDLEQLDQPMNALVTKSAAFYNMDAQIKAAEREANRTTAEDFSAWKAVQGALDHGLDFSQIDGNLLQAGLRYKWLAETGKLSMEQLTNDGKAWTLEQEKQNAVLQKEAIDHLKYMDANFHTETRFGVGDQGPTKFNVLVDNATISQNEVYWNQIDRISRIINTVLDPAYTKLSDQYKRMGVDLSDFVTEEDLNLIAFDKGAEAAKGLSTLMLEAQRATKAAWDQLLSNPFMIAVDNFRALRASMEAANTAIDAQNQSGRELSATYQDMPHAFNDAALAATETAGAIAGIGAALGSLSSIQSLSFLKEAPALLDQLAKAFVAFKAAGVDPTGDTGPTASKGSAMGKFGAIMQFAGVAGSFISKASQSRAAQAVGGALSGAMTGFMIGAYTGNPIAMVAGAVIGGVVGAIAGAIKGHPAWQKVSDEISTNMGLSISQGAAESILNIKAELGKGLSAFNQENLTNNLSGALGISPNKLRETLGLDIIMKDVGITKANIATFATDAVSQMSLVAAGGRLGDVAFTHFNDTFAQLASSSEQFGTRGSTAMMEIVKLANDAGVATDSMKTDFMNLAKTYVPQLDAALSNLGKTVSTVLDSKGNFKTKFTLLDPAKDGAKVADLQGQVKDLEAQLNNFEARKQTASVKLSEMKLHQQIEDINKKIHSFTTTTTDDVKLTADEFQVFAAGAIASFQSMVAGGMSVTDALSAMDSTLTKLHSLGDTPALQQIFDLQKIAHDFPDVINKLNGLGASMKFLGEIGKVDPATLKAYDKSLVDIAHGFDKAGVSEKEYLTLMAPQIALAKQVAMVNNTELSPALKQLIKDGEGFGISFASTEDPTKTMANDMSDLVTIMMALAKSFGVATDKLKLLSQASKDFQSPSVTVPAPGTTVPAQTPAPPATPTTGHSTSAMTRDPSSIPSNTSIHVHIDGKEIYGETLYQATRSGRARIHVNGIVQ